MCIKSENTSSTYFNVPDGVCQGGVLSPKLFAIYVDDLSLDLDILLAKSIVHYSSSMHAV